MENEIFFVHLERNEADWGFFEGIVWEIYVVFKWIFARPCFLTFKNFWMIFSKSTLYTWVARWSTKNDPRMEPIVKIHREPSKIRGCFFCLKHLSYFNLLILIILQSFFCFSREILEESATTATTTTPTPSPTATTPILWAQQKNLGSNDEVAAPGRGVRCH